MFVYQDLDYHGSFRCDDEFLNEIYDTAAYTCHLNMQTMLWDGIKLDRMVWIGDMHPEMLTIRSVFGRQPIIEKSMDFAMWQAPLPGWMNDFPTYSMWWVQLMWDWYWYTRDITFLQERRDYLSGLLRQLSDLIDTDGSDHIPDYFLDWPTRGTAAAVSGSRSLLRLALQAGANIAKLFADKSLTELCLQKLAFMYCQKENYGEFKQTAAFLVLSGAMTAEDAANEILSKNGAQGLSTFLSYYTLKMLAEGGYKAEAMRQLREYYGAMLNRGATTFWEDFNIDWTRNPGRIDELNDPDGFDLHGDNGAHCYTGFRHSLCHGWASGPVPFLMEQVLGIRISEAGCTKLDIKPYLGDMRWAQGTFHTPSGIIHIRHDKRTDGTIDTEIQLPKGVIVTM